MVSRRWLRARPSSARVRVNLFSAMSALSLALSLVLCPQAQPFLRYPDVHGDQIVFSSEGDLWIVYLKSGHAERMTSDPGVEDNPVFSPHGTMVAFHGEYDGIRGAYVMPTSGRAPHRLTPANNL